MNEFNKVGRRCRFFLSNYIYKYIFFSFVDMKWSWACIVVVEFYFTIIYTIYILLFLVPNVLHVFVGNVRSNIMWYSTISNHSRSIAMSYFIPYYCIMKILLSYVPSISNILPMGLGAGANTRKRIAGKNPMGPPRRRCELCCSRVVVRVPSTIIFYDGSCIVLYHIKEWSRRNSRHSSFYGPTSEPGKQHPLAIKEHTMNVYDTPW